jgi:sigma-B regulation protein RsbU (phosphoserine phosphatase)
MPNEVSGMLLGIMEGTSFEAFSLTLQPGDSLLLFTDGVTDAENPAHAQFARKGLLNALQGAPLAPATMCDRLVKAVKQHSTGQKQVDDITLVSVGRV